MDADGADLTVAALCALLGVLVGPGLAQLSRVLATRDPLGSGLRRAPWTLGRREFVCSAGAAALFGAAGLRWGVGARLVPHLALFATLLVVSVIDIEQYRIPNRITYPAALATAAVIPAASLMEGAPAHALRAGLGAAVFAGVLLLAHLAQPKGMGLGDVKLAVLLGAFLGWAGSSIGRSVLLVLSALFVASVVGTVVGVVVLVVRRRNAPFPFGPALALGTALVLLAAPSVRLLGLTG